jgi:hypothetical protein
MPEQSTSESLQLLSRSQPREMKPQGVDISTLIHQIAEILESSLEGEIRITLNVSVRRCTVQSNSDEVDLAILNGAKALRRTLGRGQQVLATEPTLEPVPPADPTRVRFGTKRLDHDTQTLVDDEGNEHPLARSEYQLLKVFAANPKRVLSRERLLELANAREGDPFDRSIDLRIHRIRRKIEPELGSSYRARRGIFVFPIRRRVAHAHYKEALTSESA